MMSKSTIVAIIVACFWTAILAHGNVIEPRELKVGTDFGVKHANEIISEVEDQIAEKFGKIIDRIQPKYVRQILDSGEKFYGFKVKIIQVDQAKSWALLAIRKMQCPFSKRTQVELLDVKFYIKPTDKITEDFFYPKPDYEMKEQSMISKRNFKKFTEILDMFKDKIDRSSNKTISKIEPLTYRYVKSFHRGLEIYGFKVKIILANNDEPRYALLIVHHDYLNNWFYLYKTKLDINATDKISNKFFKGPRKEPEEIPLLGSSATRAAYMIHQVQEQIEKKLGTEIDLVEPKAYINLNFGPYEDYYGFRVKMTLANKNESWALLAILRDNDTISGGKAPKLLNIKLDINLSDKLTRKFLRKKRFPPETAEEQIPSERTDYYRKIVNDFKHEIGKASGKKIANIEPLTLRKIRSWDMHIYGIKARMTLADGQETYAILVIHRHDSKSTWRLYKFKIDVKSTDKITNEFLFDALRTVIE